MGSKLEGEEGARFESLRKAKYARRNTYLYIFPYSSTSQAILKSKSIKSILYFSLYTDFIDTDLLTVLSF